jgi:ubiquinone/menaquinone biosynthesis C-methylase UbiE
MIEAARAKLEHPVVEFLCADFFELKDIQADHAFFVSSFPHFTDQKRAAEQAAAVLRPGGRMTISNIQGKYCADSADILAPMLPAQGLINLLRPYFRIDVIIDNRAMFLISGVRLHK